MLGLPSPSSCMGHALPLPCRLPFSQVLELRSVVHLAGLVLPAGHFDDIGFLRERTWTCAMDRAQTSLEVDAPRWFFWALSLPISVLAPEVNQRLRRQGGYRPSCGDERTQCIGVYAEKHRDLFLRRLAIDHLPQQRLAAGSPWPVELRGTPAEI